MLLPCAAFAKNDTIPANMKDVSKWIEEPYVNKNGKPSVKHYVIWKGYLLTTTKTTVEKASLAKKHGANCNLIVIGSGSGKTFKPKRLAIY
mgnify:CR=1 FL=1